MATESSGFGKLWEALIGGLQTELQKPQNSRESGSNAMRDLLAQYTPDELDTLVRDYTSDQAIKAGEAAAPFLTPEQMIEYLTRWQSGEDQKGQENREFDLKELEIAQQQEQIANQAIRDLSASAWNHAGRGLANSSIRDVALADISSRASLQRANLQDTLDTLRTHRDAALLRIDQARDQEEIQWDKIRQENAARVSETMPNPYAARTSTTPPKQNENQQQKIKRWQQRGPMPPPGTAAWQRWAKDMEERDRQEFGILLYGAGAKPPAAPSPGGAPNVKPNTNTQTPAAPGTAPAPPKPNTNVPSAPGAGKAPTPAKPR